MSFKRYVKHSAYKGTQVAGTALRLRVRPLDPAAAARMLATKNMHVLSKGTSLWENSNWKPGMLWTLLDWSLNNLLGTQHGQVYSLSGLEFHMHKSGE